MGKDNPLTTEDWERKSYFRSQKDGWAIVREGGVFMRILGNTPSDGECEQREATEIGKDILGPPSRTF